MGGLASGLYTQNTSYLIPVVKRFYISVNIKNRNIFTAFFLTFGAVAII